MVNRKIRVNVNANWLGISLFGQHSTPVFRKSRHGIILRLGIPIVSIMLLAAHLGQTYLDQLAVMAIPLGFFLLTVLLPALLVALAHFLARDGNRRDLRESDDDA